jgi:hypothetical protein
MEAFFMPIIRPTKPAAPTKPASPTKPAAPTKPASKPKQTIKRFCRELIAGQKNTDKEIEELIKQKFPGRTVPSIGKTRININKGLRAKEGFPAPKVPYKKFERNKSGALIAVEELEVKRGRPASSEKESEVPSKKNSKTKPRQDALEYDGDGGEGEVAYEAEEDDETLLRETQERKAVDKAKKNLKKASKKK